MVNGKLVDKIYILERIPNHQTNEPTKRQANERIYGKHDKMDEQINTKHAWANYRDSSTPKINLCVRHKQKVDYMNAEINKIKTSWSVDKWKTNNDWFIFNRWIKNNREITKQ